MVETAVVLMVFILFIMACIEMGNIFNTWLRLQAAADVGSRFAATGQGDLDGTRLAKIVTAVNSVIPGLPHAAPVITVRSWEKTNVVGDGRLNDPGKQCDTVQITISYSYHLIVPLLSSFMPSQITLTGEDRKVNEPWQPCD